MIAFDQFCPCQTRQNCHCIWHIPWDTISRLIPSLYYRRWPQIPISVISRKRIHSQKTQMTQHSRICSHNCKLLGICRFFIVISQILYDSIFLAAIFCFWYNQIFWNLNLKNESDAKWLGHPESWSLKADKKTQDMIHVHQTYELFWN